MALSIKDEETDALVRRLAAARNLSFTGAIKLAVSNELERDEPRDRGVAEDRARRLASIHDIQARVASRGGLPPRDVIDAWLYDDVGAPR